MGLKCGIIGMPNVGKSTLFNALTNSIQAEAANYPFCTIEPNVGIVFVPDQRLEKIAKIADSQKVIPTQIEFVDIAGLVKGASKGEGLGNKFLSHIREVDAIVHVLRCFENDDISHVEGGIDPVRDAEIIELELILADIESLEKRIPNTEKKAKQQKELKKELEMMQEALKVLNENKPARILFDKYPANELRELHLLTTKPMLYLCNISDEQVISGNEFSKAIEEKSSKDGAKVVLVSAQIEAEIAQIADLDERSVFLKEYGLEESGLSRLIQSAYSLLGLITYFTVGPKEARAWTIKNGTVAPGAAGEIHTDFEKGFIRAETIKYTDYIKCSGESGARDAGKLRVEGKEYIVEDGDVMHFRFNV